MLLAVVLLAFAPEITSSVTPPVITKDKLVQAIRKVESGGIPESEVKDGDSGKAIGPLQIWEVCFKDANLKDYKYEDCRRFSVAKKVFYAYMDRYAGKSWNDKMTLAEAEKVARIWNGGPKGHTKETTKAYWRKVVKHLR